MKSAALIRCNSITENELSLKAMLVQHFGASVYFIVENISGTSVIPSHTENFIIMDGPSLEELRLPVFNKVGWRCGDYSLYVADRNLSQAYEYLWLIESDVAFSFKDISGFFGNFDLDGVDFTAPTFGKRSSNWFWHQTLSDIVGPENVWGCLFPITRTSRRAVKYLLEQRVSISKRIIEEQGGELKDFDRIPNDEVFVSSMLHNGGFSCEAMEKIAPTGALSPETFHSEFPVMPEEVFLHDRRDRVLHPVRDKSGARWKFVNMRLKHSGVYEKKKAYITQQFGAAAWQSWSGEAVGETSLLSEADRPKGGPSFKKNTQAPVYIHIGFHKTGTTYIQALLKNNESILEDFYIVNQRSQNSKLLRCACQELFSGKHPNDAVALENIVQRFREVADSADGKTIIISDEEMFGFIPGRHGYYKLYHRAEDIMNCAVQAFPGRYVKFFAYSRPRMKWLESVYAEAVKNHHLCTDYRSFLQNLKFDDSLDQLSLKLQDKFGADRFMFADMSEDRSKEFGLGASMFEWFGIKPEILSTLKKPSRANEAVPATIQEAFLILNNAGLPGAQLMDIKNRILAALRA